MDLQAALERRWVAEQRHPALPLRIYNYTPLAVYEKAWNPITLTHRGLVVDDAGAIVAHCLPKFFNLGEHEKDALPDLPNEPFEVMEKLDGSYISLSHYQGQAVVASRGAFESPQAELARMLLAGVDWEPNPSWTYIFELIHPRNRIVVNYGDRGELVLLEVMDANGAYVDRKSWPTSFSHAQLFPPVADPRALLVGNRIGTEAEGFVLRYASGLRVKVKFPEYLAAHKVLSGLTPRRVGEAMRDNSLDAVIAEAPDEFHEWVRETAAQIAVNVDAHQRAARAAFARLSPLADDRKRFAQATRSEPADLQAALFALIDGKSIGPWAWKRVLPTLEKTPLLFEPNKAR